MSFGLVESILIILLVVVLFLVAILIFRGVLFGRLPERVEPVEGVPVEAEVVAEHLAAAIRLPTISLMDQAEIDASNFVDLQAELVHMYPRIHGALVVEPVGENSLLYTWAGSNPELEPVLLCAHQDVVPVDPASRENWSYDPYGGVVADGFVWGRGALDMKSVLITQMEAIEGLLRAGFQPERTLYLALGHDEEIGGLGGARLIAQLLQERGVRLSAVIDEGGAIMEGGVPGVSVPVAMVGIAEKGHTSIELRVEGRPGHSSTPPPHTAIGVLARAITRIESNPLPVRMSMVQLMFEDLGPFLPFGMRLALANSWLFGGQIRKRLERTPETNAMIRTSQAVTIIQGGVKDNIVPAMARAVVNCRLLPGDSSAKVFDHLRRVVSDEAVQIIPNETATWEASRVSAVGSPVYQDLSRTIRQVFPEALVAPYLVLGATDSRYYSPLSENVFRFSPYFLDAELLRTIHGTDERIPVEVLSRMVQFYTQLIRSWTTPIA